ncbi:neurofilament medium polypeptide-like [Zingiber officinale]|uniref:neurofilament medium polypeptide-like n=1 Tax=Zingiber officinale TaxID=94328 RepID=UPI001C4C2016|nr:neurofilament medium polypeptide-like [Zingiber officinale]
MYIFGLSPIPADLPCSMTKVMWRAKATERLKLRAAEIEAAKNREVTERSLASAGLASGEGERTQSVPEALDASASLGEAADEIEPTQVGMEGRSADEAPLATRKRRRPEPATQPTPSEEPQSERGDAAPVLSGTVSIESTPKPRGSPRATSEVPPSSPPRTMRRLRRLGDFPSSSGEPSGKAAVRQGDPSGPRLTKTVLRLPSKEYMATVDRPVVPEQQITLTSPLAKDWEDARLRIAMITPEAIKVAVEYLKCKGHIPTELAIPPEDLAVMMGSIPDSLFNFGDSE